MRFPGWSFLLRIACVVLAVAGPLAGAATAQQQAAPALSEAQREAVRGVVREMLLNQPELIQEALNELERRQAARAAELRERILGDSTSPLFTSPFGAVVGNPQGNVTLVEFFDYNCGFCRRALGDLQKILAEDRQLRVILRDFPVLGTPSLEAATVALAAKEQLKGDAFFAFHVRLYGKRGPIGRQQALEAAQESGVDIARLQRDMDNPAIRGAIEETIQLGDQLGLSGTPTYVVGGDIVAGAVGVEELKARIANVRRCGKATC